MTSTVDRSINYIEFPVTDLPAAKAFFASVFGWKWKDWGPEYADCSNAGVSCGLRLEADAAPTGALVVLYADDLEATQARILEHGGEITLATITFPGGKRFQFRAPGDVELAVWVKE